MPKHNECFSLVPDNHTSIDPHVSPQPINVVGRALLHRALGLPGSAQQQYNTGSMGRVSLHVLKTMQYRLVSFGECEELCRSTRTQNRISGVPDKDKLQHNRFDRSWHFPEYAYVNDDEAPVYFNNLQRDNPVASFRRHRCRFENGRNINKLPRGIGGILLKRMDTEVEDVTLDHDPFKLRVDAVASGNDVLYENEDDGDNGDGDDGDDGSSSRVKKKPKLDSSSAAAARPKQKPGKSSSMKEKLTATPPPAGEVQKLPQGKLLKSDSKAARPKPVDGAAAAVASASASASTSIPLAVKSSKHSLRAIPKPQRGDGGGDGGGAAAAAAAPQLAGAGGGSGDGIEYSADDGQATTRTYEAEAEPNLKSDMNKGQTIYLEVYDRDHQARGDEWEDPSGDTWPESKWFAAYNMCLAKHQKDLLAGEITRPQHDTLTKEAFAAFTTSGMVQAPAVVKKEIAEELLSRNLPVAEFYKRLALAIQSARRGFVAKRSVFIRENSVVDELLQHRDADTKCLMCCDALVAKVVEREQVQRELKAKPMCLCTAGAAKKNNVLLTYCHDCAQKHAHERTIHNPGCQSVLFSPQRPSYDQGVRLL